VTGMKCLPCVDSEARAVTARRLLDIDRGLARDLGWSAVDAIEAGIFETPSGRVVDWSAQVTRARAQRRSIPPSFPIVPAEFPGFESTTVQVVNATTMQVAYGLVCQGHRPAVLNLANGISPGGGFLHGARAQEESLCRASGLYATLVGDEMYDHHLGRPEPDSTDWVIWSPEVPVFRDDSGVTLEQTWTFDVLTSAAPVAQRIGQPLSGDLLERRIHRVLEVAAAEKSTMLVLGAWGCGAFGNDPVRTARNFRSALENQFRGWFEHVVFAITDWSPERKVLGPFRDVFAA
jgi:uncharacterized protein (TIGR02452 family)